MSNQQNVTTMVEYKSFALPAPMDASFDAADVAEDLEGLELSFPRVKIPGGGVPQFKMPGEDPDHPTYVGEIEGIILYNHSANACWPEGSEYDDNTPPQCQSMDGKQGYGDPGLLCEACGNNQFGSSGKGKLCKNMRMLYILQDGAYMPLHHCVAGHGPQRRRGLPGGGTPPQCGTTISGGHPGQTAQL